MGIFKSFATSGFGDFSTGALRGIAEQGVADAKNNAIFAQDALLKENEEFSKVERAFDNMKEISNIITKNPLAFGITGDNIEQTSDRSVTMMYSEQPSIFEHKNIKDVRMDVAKYFASDLSKPIELSSPYTPSADLFKFEQEKNAANISAITKMPKTDKLLLQLKGIREDSTPPEARTDLETEVVKFSAKAYGILNTFPTTELGRTNQNATMSAIVVANARREFPNDATARANFIETKLRENGIDVLEAVKFQKPVSYRGMIRILDAQGSNIASEISRLTNSLAQAETEEKRASIQSQINQQLMKQHFMINSYSGSKLYALAGKDANKVGQLGQITVTPRIDEVEPEEEGQTPGLFRRETKPRRPLKEVLPDFRDDASEDAGLDPFQARATNETPVARQASAVDQTPVARPAGGVYDSTTFQKLTKNKNMEFSYNYLNKTLRPEASAALLGNISVESPKFLFDQEENTTRKNKGYGLFQFTNNLKNEGHRVEYFKYLEKTKKEDSIESQIDYVMDNIYKGIGYNIGAGNRKKLQEVFKNGNTKEVTKAFHDLFLRPQPGSLKTRENFAEQAFTFYRFI